jgi:hypothetical protein
MMSLYRHLSSPHGTVVEATASKRAQAHRQLLRKVKIELERLCEEEKVREQKDKCKPSMLTSRRLLQMQRYWLNGIRSSYDGSR